MHRLRRSLIECRGGRSRYPSHRASNKQAQIVGRRKLAQNLLRGVLNPMSEFKFEPIKVNSTAPGGACVLRTFDDVGAFILLNVGVSRRKSQCWQAVRQDLSQARFGARRAEVHKAIRDALAEEGWLAD